MKKMALKPAAGGGSSSSIAVTGAADGQSTVSKASRVLRLFEQFRGAWTDADMISDARWCAGVAFVSLRASTLAWKALWEAFTGYLVHNYVKNDGGHLAAASVRSYLGAALRKAHDLFKNMKDLDIPERRTAEYFFTCLAKLGGTPMWTWLHKLRLKVDRLCYDRCKENGEKMDFSAKPLTLSALRGVIQNYARHNTKEAATRCLALLSGWQAVGRSA
jgi:hypothetical protein